MNPEPDRNSFFCEKCKGKGAYLDMAESFHGILRFCSCSEGERKRRDWEAYDERVKAEARRRMRKKTRQVRDFKLEAAGRNGIEDDDDVPF